MPPPEPPIPIAATWQKATSTVTATFNKALQPGVIARGNWGGAADFLPDPPFGNSPVLANPPVVAAGITVTFTAAAGVGIPPTQFLDYYALPPDLVGANGLPVAPFSNFPMTTI